VSPVERQYECRHVFLPLWIRRLDDRSCIQREWTGEFASDFLRMRQSRSASFFRSAEHIRAFDKAQDGDAMSRADAPKSPPCAVADAVSSRFYKKYDIKLKARSRDLFKRASSNERKGLTPRECLLNFAFERAFESSTSTRGATNY